MRTKKPIDFGRLRDGIRGPGADTRVWAAMARVDDDVDALRWDDELGWLVDVTFSGGPLDQDGPIVCRVAQSFARDGGTRIEPVTRGQEVVVLIVDGDPNSNPVIVGQTHNGGGDAPPSVSESEALDTHLLITPHKVRWETGGNITLETTGAKLQLIAALVELSTAGASQAFVRGTDFAAALKQLLQAWSSETSAALSLATTMGAQISPPLATLAPGGAAWAAQLTLLSSAITTFSGRLVSGDLLSTKVVGE